MLIWRPAFGTCCVVVCPQYAEETEARRFRKRDAYIYIYISNLYLYLIYIYIYNFTCPCPYLYVCTYTCTDTCTYICTCIYITHILVESQSFRAKRIIEIICPFPHFPNEKNMLRMQCESKKYFAQLETTFLQVHDVSCVCGIDYKWNSLPECFSLFRLQVLLITNTSECFLHNHFHSTPVSWWQGVVGPRNSSMETDSPKSVSLAFVCEENGRICGEIRA